MALRTACAVGLVFLMQGMARAQESPLSSGTTFPDLAGKTLAGSDIVVGMRDGLPKVLVMAFTKDATKPAQAWLDACRADITTQPEPGSAVPPVACYDVRMVTSLPPLVRGFVEGRMRKGVRARDLSHVVLITKDKELWRDRLMVMPDSEDDPFIVMVDREGRVQSLLRGIFNATALKTEQAKLVSN